MNAPLRSEGLASGWCLRFLSGAMKGRTIALVPGANVLGSSGECEVMLPGGDVLPRHLVIFVGELVVSVQKIGTGHLRLNGEDVQQTRRSLVVGDVLSVGSIELQLEPSLVAARPDEDPLFAAPEHPAGDQAAATPVPTRQRIAFWSGASLLVVAAIGLLALAMWGGGGQAGPAGAGVRADLAAVQRALAPFHEVEVVALPGGRFGVKGFVESTTRREALRQAVAPFGNQVDSTVYAADELVEQVRRYVGAPGVAISYAGKGRLEVSGTSDDELVRQKLRRIGEDLHPAVIVADKVQYKPSPRPDKDETLRAQWAAWQQLLPARLVSITEDADGLHSIQLANGNRYYEGSVLKSGAELQRIDANGLVLHGGVPTKQR